MNHIQIQDWLNLFENVSCFYRKMLMGPLWNKYLNYQNNHIHALAIFLEGYAFERRGRRPDYFHAAVDSVFYCNRQNNLSANCVWDRFKQLLNNQKLNHKNNPLYPSSDPDRININQNKFSVIEVISQLNNISLSYYIKTLIIQNNNIKQSFNFLKRIRGISDKIASFYLRDLVVVLNVNLNNIQNRWLLQPIDVWVERTVNNLSSQNMTRRGIANWIVNNSLIYNLNPEYINMGIWFYSALIVGSEYKLNQSLQNINEAQRLINDFRSRIRNVCQHC